MEQGAAAPVRNCARSLALLNAGQPIPRPIVLRAAIDTVLSPNGGRLVTRQSRRPFVPRLERLEDRTVPSTLTILNNLDSGPGSLRAVLAGAANGDTVAFAPSLSGKTITLTSGPLSVNTSVRI